ncbi:MAG: hypothetical protein ACXWUG_01275 [Polyangiales bacterium]
MAAGASALLLSLALVNPAHRLNELKEKPLSYWEPGDFRPFVSTRIDASLNFAKGNIAVGYGKPHWIWIGVEGFALTTTEFTAAYAGVRASTPVLDIAYGVRDNRSYFRNFLVPAEHHTLEDRRADIYPRQRYLATELEISGLGPVLGGYAIWAVNIDRILDAPQGVHIYEESLRAVARKWLVSTRIGYVYPFGPDGMVKAGVMGEYVALPDRPSNVLRLGPATVLTITEHLEMLFLLCLPVASPDSLGIAAGTYAVLSLRYRWATGERNPHFP